MADLITTDQVNPEGGALGDTLVRNPAGVFVPSAPSAVAMRPAWTNPSGAPPVPAAGDQGRFWRQSDTGIWYVANFNGVSWSFQAAAIADDQFALRLLLQVNPAVQRVWWGALNPSPVDYAALPQWAYSVVVTGLMGTAPEAPNFYCLRQAQIAGLTYDADGLTYTLPAASLVAPAAGWPGDNAAGEVVVPITAQVGRRIVVTAVIRTNLPAQAAPGAGEVTIARLLLSRAVATAGDPNDPPDAACEFTFTRDAAVNGGAITEATSADGGAIYSADLSAEVVGGEVVRAVMFEILGPQVAVHTGDPSAPLAQRSAAFNHAENIATTAWILSLCGFHQDYAATPAGSFVRLESLVIDQLD